jgi:ribA/ribD-fused uncharacterized protein
MYPDSNLHLNRETDDTIYFFETAYSPLCSWSAHSVYVWGRRFPTVEHAYHWRKHRDTAPDVAELIAAAHSPWMALQIEHWNKHLRTPEWGDIKVGMMRELLQAKSAQNEDVRQCLRRSGNKRLVENSPWDDFWGCGADGTGRNMLGELWMEIRSGYQASA